jgi:PAS domain S-box-containing protein
MNTEKIQVLLVEDNATDALIVQDELAHTTGAGFSVVHLEALHDTLARLELETFDVVLLDLSLPDSHGLETFWRLHAATDVPIVVLSGQADEELAAQAVQAGAQDYLVKGRLQEDVLPRSIRYAIERQRAERTLAESEERYRSLIESSPNGYLVHAGGKIVFANTASMKLFGADRLDQLVGKPFLATVSPEFHDLISHRAESAHANGSNAPVEVLGLRLDGTTVALEGTSNPFIHEGKPAVQVVLHDITERRLAEADARERSELLQAIFDHIPVMLCFMDQTGRIGWVNREAERVFGWSLVEIQAQPDIFTEWYPEPAYRAKVLAFIRESTGKFAEFHTTTRTGTVSPTSWASVLLADGSSVGIGLDITDRKRAETRFRWLVDSNAQGVFFWNTAGGVTGGNDAFLEMVGYSRAELESGEINWTMMTPPEYAESDRRSLEEIAAKGFCAPYEKEWLRKDGSRVPILIGAAVFEDCPEEGVCFVLDLTERKRIEQNALRTQRMESIGTLAGGIAHDLNNTLSPIIMSLDLLKTKFTDPGSQELLAIVSASAQRGADMVGQVLSFARGVEGRRMEVQVKHLLREVAKIVNDTFLKHIQVRVIIPHNLATVAGDPTQLHQVLLNLCVNARDAMPDGGTLTIAAESLVVDAHYAGLSLHSEAKPGSYILIRVKDSGTGMPREVLEKAFDPFFTTKEIGKGTGLGLSTSLAIIKSHGGFIHVYSEPGKGTEFKIYLPAQTENSPAVAAERDAEMPHGHGELILVVDDEAAVREITQRTLESYGYRALLAAEGTEAVAIYGQQRAEIAVVLTDMMMPLMDGPTAIQILRRMNPAVRIIGASGLSDEDHVAHATSLGVKHFLPKPYTAETLLVTLRQVLAGNR